MTYGVVKWFNNTKGYGFVRADHLNEDLFVHYSYIQMDGYRSIKAGQRVEFEITKHNNGLHAMNLRYSEVQDNEIDYKEHTTSTEPA